MRASLKEPATSEAEGALYTSQQVNWDKGDALTDRVLKEYEAKYKRRPSAYVLNYYNAVNVFGELAAALQKEGKPVTGENLLEQRRKMTQFEFVGATVKFAADGTIDAPIGKQPGTGGEKMQVDTEAGLKAKTRYRVIERAAGRRGGAR